MALQEHAIKFQKDFPTDQYYNEVMVKKQIVLHHTVSGPGVVGDIGWWNKTPEKVATAFIIDRDGVIYQMFNSGKWAHHLGIPAVAFQKLKIAPNNTELNKQSIGIELDSWGGLVLDEKLGWTIPTNGKVIDNENVVEFDEKYRGYKAFEKYYPKQLEACKELVEYLGAKYQIPLTYDESIWDVSVKALSGNKGVFSHTSYRSDKSDCSPQPDLIAMLKSLK